MIELGTTKMKTHLLATSLLALLLFGFCIHAPAQKKATETLPVLYVELDEFGFRGDFLRIRFEKGFEKAWEESLLPYRIEFKSFPVKDYKGSPAIELRLNYWESWFPGQRTINFWASFVTPDGAKHKLDIIHHEGRTANALFYSAVERSYEEQATEATLLLLERIRPLLEEI